MQSRWAGSNLAGWMMTAGGATTTCGPVKILPFWLNTGCISQHLKLHCQVTTSPTTRRPSTCSLMRRWLFRLFFIEDKRMQMCAVHYCCGQCPIITYCPPSELCGTSRIQRTGSTRFFPGSSPVCGKFRPTVASSTRGLSAASTFICVPARER